MEVCECTSKQAQSSQGLRFWVSTNVIAGVKLRLPVLADGDVRDVQEFAVKNRMDFVAISFVQCVDDVRYGVITCVRQSRRGGEVLLNRGCLSPWRRVRGLSWDACFLILFDAYLFAPGCLCHGQLHSAPCLDWCVRLARWTLDYAGGESIKLISKIESTNGLLAYDEILEESDGIMVARGDLAMEIPPEKVSRHWQGFFLAQEPYPVNFLAGCAESGKPWRKAALFGVSLSEPDLAGSRVLFRSPIKYLSLVRVHYWYHVGGV